MGRGPWLTLLLIVIFALIVVSQSVAELGFDVPSFVQTIGSLIMLVGGIQSATQIVYQRDLVHLFMKWMEGVRAGRVNVTTEIRKNICADPVVNRWIEDLLVPQVLSHVEGISI